MNHSGMKFIVACILIFALTPLFANRELSSSYSDSLVNAISLLQSKQQKLSIEVSTLYKSLERQSDKIDSLHLVIMKQDSLLVLRNQEMEDHIDKNARTAHLRTEQQSLSIKKRTVVFLIGGLLVISAFLITLVIASRNIRKAGSSLKKKITDVQGELEAKTVTVDSKLLQLAQKQLLLLQRESSTLENSNEANHSLVMNIADEIVRIQQNMTHMDPNIQGYKQLNRAINSILSDMENGGYEIPDLVNKSFNENMKAIVHMELDTALEQGQQIIKRVIKPQVNYRGKMVQAAEIIVAYND